MVGLVVGTSQVSGSIPIEVLNRPNNIKLHMALGIPRMDTYIQLHKRTHQPGELPQVGLEPTTSCAHPIELPAD